MAIIRLRNFYIIGFDIHHWRAVLEEEIRIGKIRHHPDGLNFRTSETHFKIVFSLQTFKKIYLKISKRAIHFGS